MGAGKMGSFFIDLLSFEHDVAVFEKTQNACGSHITASGFSRLMR